VLDRREKDAITLLFAAIPENRSIKVKRKPKEIKKAAFHISLYLINAATGHDVAR
jgi:hypothetical protein